MSTDRDSDTAHSITDVPTGRRFVARDSERWQIEQELAAEGVDLANRAIPVAYRELADADAVREAIETEMAAEPVNKQAIAYLNERLEVLR